MPDRAVYNPPPVGKQAVSLTESEPTQHTRQTTRLFLRAGVVAVAYIAFFAVLDAQLETHAATNQQMTIRLIVVTIALVGALGALMHVLLRARAAQDEIDRRMQKAQEEARLQGALLTIRELAPWVGPKRAPSGGRVAGPRVAGVAGGAEGSAGESRARPFAFDAAALSGRVANSRLLTTREREVALLIAQGRTSREIAEALVITERTADTHADRIRVKLGLHSRAEIVAWVLSQGLEPAQPA